MVKGGQWWLGVVNSGQGWSKDILCLYVLDTQVREVEGREGEGRRGEGGEEGREGAHGPMGDSGTIMDI